MRHGLKLPLSSMRLLVAPVRLMSAYMWQVAQQRCVDQYGKLAEFISLVTQMVPELLSFRQRAQLILGLRARLTLELLQRVETSDPQVIQDNLNTIQDNLNTIQDILNTVRQWTTNCMQEEDLEEKVEISKQAFVELVQTLLKNPSERKDFFKDVFPVQYDACFDTTLQILVWEFLSRLEEFLPVPSFSQIASSSSTVLLDSDEGQQFVSDPEDLKMLLQHHRQHRKMTKNQFSFETDTILSTLASKQTSEMCTDQDKYPMENTRVLVENYQRSEGSLQRWREKMWQEENKLSERDIHEEEEGFNKAVGSNFQQQSPLRAPLSSPETDTEVPDDLLVLENNCLDVPVNNERKVKCHLRRKDRNPGAERTQGSTGDGSEDLLPSCRPDSCPTKITKKHSCPQCGKSFRHRSDMTRHRDTVHSLVKPFKCHQCENRFKTKYTLASHLQIHTDHKPHICSYCSRAFRTKDTLKEHVRTHTGERPYACTLCERRFTQMHLLTTHLRMHKGERPYLCSDCGKTFCESGALLVHSRQHTGERPYHCDVCGKDYITLQRLKTHQRFHTGERPYACPDCEKYFHTQSGVRKHSKTHTGEKPFQCPKCDKRFSQNSNMRVHLRSHR